MESPDPWIPQGASHDMPMSHVLVHLPLGPERLEERGTSLLRLWPSPPSHSALQSLQEPWLQLKPGRAGLRGRWYS